MPRVMGKKICCGCGSAAESQRKPRPGACPNGTSPLAASEPNARGPSLRVTLFHHNQRVHDLIARVAGAQRWGFEAHQRLDAALDLLPPATSAKGHPPGRGRAAATDRGARRRAAPGSGHNGEGNAASRGPETQPHPRRKGTTGAQAISRFAQRLAQDTGLRQRVQNVERQLLNVNVEM